MSDNNFQGPQPYSGQFTNPMTGQTDYWGGTTTSPTKKHRRWPWVVAVVVAVLGVMIAANGSGDKAEPAAQPANIVASTYVPPAFTAAPAVPRTTAPKPVTSPLNTDGTYRVGTQIAPGLYAYTMDGLSGYYARCADVECDPFGGMIANDFITASSGYLELLPTDAFVELRGLTLTPA